MTAKRISIFCAVAQAEGGILEGGQTPLARTGGVSIHGWASCWVTRDALPWFGRRMLVSQTLGGGGSPEKSRSSRSPDDDSRIVGRDRCHDAGSWPRAVSGCPDIRHGEFPTCVTFCGPGSAATVSGPLRRGGMHPVRSRPSLLLSCTKSSPASPGSTLVVVVARRATWTASTPLPFRSADSPGRVHQVSTLE